MYIAKDNKVYYVWDDNEELFLEVHLIKDSTKTVIQQAEILADLLNGISR